VPLTSIKPCLIKSVTGSIEFDKGADYEGCMDELVTVMKVRATNSTRRWLGFRNELNALSHDSITNPLFYKYRGSRVAVKYNDIDKHYAA